MTLTQDYIDAEEASQRKPAELYHFWRAGGGDIYHTSGDVSVDYDGNTYTPATLKRGRTKKNNELNVTQLAIQALNLGDTISDFVKINPVEVLWVSVMKIHRDQVPLEASVVFLGQVKNVAFSGVAAEITCVGFESTLKMPIPQWRFQTTCNHKLFDARCALTKASYKTSTAITLDSTKTQLTSTDFGTEDDGYFTHGEVQFGDEHRPIIAHSGDIITIAYQMNDLADTDTVDAYPGCDGRPETCRDKFNNVVHGLWFKYIPVENPAERTTL